MECVLEWKGKDSASAGRDLLLETVCIVYTISNNIPATYYHGQPVSRKKHLVLTCPLTNGIIYPNPVPCEQESRDGFIANLIPRMRGGCGEVRA